MPAASTRRRPAALREGSPPRSPSSYEQGPTSMDLDQSEKNALLSPNTPSDPLEKRRAKADAEDSAKPYWQRSETRLSWAVGWGMVGLAAVVRFWGIDFPGAVVFDEVHFGKFASYYLRREYYFDVHPPLSKMLLALAGYLSSFPGNFDFTDIGHLYSQPEHGIEVPYVGMRTMPAVFGSLTVGVVFWLMRESGYAVWVAAFSAGLIAFDNLHIVETRLILLDGALILFMSLSLLSYVKFHQLRYRAFSKSWWFWLLATGASLACTMGCKMVGLFTFVTVGAAVAVDLWGLMDIRRKHPLTMERFSQHFLARVLGLILVPFLIYLSFFWVHFKILKFSGTGDSFMSAAFQESLIGNELLVNAQELRYYDTIKMRHKDTNDFLHSHFDRYPLRYPDQRVSSQGQQVTAFHLEDPNNNWQIQPTKELPATGRGRIVRNSDIIRLYHPSTDSYLLTHDVASPLTTTHQEFTTWPQADLEARKEDTEFEMMLLDGHEGEPWKTKSGWFKLRHVPTRVFLHKGEGALPEWGFRQNEVNGQKVPPLERGATWYVDEIVEDPNHPDPFRHSSAESISAEEPISEGETPSPSSSSSSLPKPPKPLSFIRKFLELQVLMLQHNAGLTASHPYASDPINWPFDLTGISFWTENEKHEQIYAIGNLVGWWICVGGMSVFVGVVGADLLARRRGVEPIEDHHRSRLYNNTAFFMFAWACHYFPFFLMSRQLFIHHYLPAHLASACVAGSVLNFILTESIDYPVSIAGPTTRLRPRLRARIGRKGAVGFGVLMAGVLAFWLFMAPLTYGRPGMEGGPINRRKLFNTWTLHFAK